MSRQIEKLKAIFYDAVETGGVFDGDLEDVNYLDTFLKAGMTNNMHDIMGTNLCLMKIKYKEEESILMIFGIPLNEESGNIKMKQISEKVLEVVKKLEQAFITLDYMNCSMSKDDHYEYLTVIKKIKDVEEDEND